jgi:hypothetical protein
MLLWYHYPLIFLAGMTAGIMNVLAGSGSVVTLPALVFLGLPADVANGTNRVGITVQCLVGTETYRRGGKLQTEGVGWLIAPTLVGTAIGAWGASQLDAAQTNIVIGVVMIGMLVVLLVDPKRWIDPGGKNFEGRPPWWMMVIMLGVGLYGGFIQAGVGVMMLAALVLGAGYEIVPANAVKMLIALIFTAVALAIFAFDGQVNWTYGALMAVGQGTGGFVGAKFAVESDEADIWIRRLLIVIVIVAASKFLGLFDLIF